ISLATRARDRRHDRRCLARGTAGSSMWSFRLRRKVSARQPGTPAEKDVPMALVIGAPAPEFTLPNQFGESVELRGFRGKRPVALVFFPLALSGRCTSELCELRDNLALFGDAGVELIGISVASKFAFRAWAEQERYDFSL